MWMMRIGGGICRWCGVSEQERSENQGMKENSMSIDRFAQLDACLADARSGALKFPQIVERLLAIGVERYHADYSRNETTYYWPDSESRVVTVEYPTVPMADAFSAAGVEAAVRASQRGEIDYPEFVRRTKAAGCIGYFVLLTGRQCQYFGRRGETHVEIIPDRLN
jgi:uncharacterized protein YbcV (DUF1398 family)